MNISTIIDIIFQDFLILYQIFFSSQVKQSMIISNKQSVIISNKHGIYELPHERLKDLRKLGKTRKISKLHRIMT